MAEKVPIEILAKQHRSHFGDTLYVYGLHI